MIVIESTSEGQFEFLNLCIGKRKIAKRNLLNRVKSDVGIRYRKYGQAIVGAMPNARYSSRISVELRRLYEMPVSVVRRALLVERLHLLKRCPYCMASEVGTLDHYLPRQDFPEYSIYFPNLIPACSSCNVRKGTKVFDASGKRIFINGKYDLAICRRKLYKINATANSGVVRFDVELTLGGFSSDERTLISNHFSYFDLYKKFRDVASEELSTKVGTWPSSNNFNDAARSILAESRNHERIYGINCPHAQSLLSISQSNSALRKICSA